MLITRLRHLLTTPTDKASTLPTRFWFSLSLTFAAIYGLLALKQAFAGDYVLQDDARQHVFWMQRFLDPTLFPQDIIADYFQSVAPAGYTALYWFGAKVGLYPMLFHKLLPMVLGLITTAYCFGISLQVLPIPATAFISSLLLNQNLWMKDDLVSATPRAFLYPFLAAFLYYLLRRSLLPCLAAIALQGLFYPQSMLLSAAVLVVRLVRWHDGKLGLSQDRQDYRFCAAGLGVTLIVLLPFALQSSEFGDVISPAEAKQLPEFLENGRTRFFINDPWEFWLSGERTGIFPNLLLPPLMPLGLLLPWQLRQVARFPLVQQVSQQAAILLQTLLASLGMFALAHLLLFKLQYPSRYTQHSLRIVMAIAAAIAITAIVDSLLRWAEQQTQGNASRRRWIALGLTGAIAGLLIFYPSIEDDFPLAKYKQGEQAALYEFFQQQPKNIMIGSISEEASFLPSFSQRSILASREYGIAFHKDYYFSFRQRTIEMIQAQYSPRLSEIQALIQKYGVDFWLLDPGAFTPKYLAEYRWLQQFDVTDEARSRLEQGTVPALAKVTEQCKAFETNGLQVLDANCLLQIPQP